VQNARVGPVIALIDGEHHPDAVREALDGLDPAGVVFCGGEEKVRAEVLADPEAHYGRPLAIGDPVESLRRLAAETGATRVVDLADEPVLPPAAKLRLAAHALHLGLAYEGPGLRLEPPPSERVEYGGRMLAVIGTGKRTGKTAVAGHLATLLRDRGASPVIVSMGRGGPAEPQLADAATGLAELERIAAEGRHAASDYLEDAVLAQVPAVGCRRVGGGLAGEPHESNVAAGARLAASLDPGAIVLEGSGSCIPPVDADRTVCVVGDRAGALEALGPYRLLRADLALVADPVLVPEVAALCPGATMAFTLRAEPAEPLPRDARVAVFSTSSAAVHGVDAVVASPALARRGALADDLDRAVAERCDVWLTELKAAAIDTVAARARAEGARIVFVRNRPLGLDGDLDAALVKLYEDA
jgi:cyclic 2,3-diphosphoglycerate synthetase